MDTAPPAAGDGDGDGDGSSGDGHGDGPRDVVQLTIPATGAFLVVLRTATASLAARADFTLDDIEDLRIAVDEACALLLVSAVPESSLECVFTLSPGVLRVTVSVDSLDGEPPSRDTFAWTVLNALAGEVRTSTGPGRRVTIELAKRRGGE
ncbi:serine/threonine-protein kinase RsbW [Parafrankia irregularis]|uniref:Serine/threonine-protein kinase RsbW n=1 Tax=Parafrankia irregularis TaxID=795642 RepID=A0A0S4QU90_9ACTN|nr:MULTISPECIES: anti-sigma factor [Parafrankia]MBE3205263.1 anti-sigma factor [Parafrankia sp. CH37]CUU58777.1 serine/threonine-protein kinase RsbW [Parafrankia irregularis]